MALSPFTGCLLWLKVRGIADRWQSQLQAWAMSTAGFLSTFLNSDFVQGCICAAHLPGWLNGH